MTSLNIRKKLSTAMNLRISGYLNGRRGLYGNAQTDINQAGAVGEIASATAAVQSSGGLAGASQTRSDDRPYVDNLDVWKDRIPRRWRSRLERVWKKIVTLYTLLVMLQKDTALPLTYRLQRLRMGRDFQPMERAAIIEDITRKRLEAFHKERARRGEKIIINTLANLGFCNRTVNDKGHAKTTSLVSFDRAEFSPLIYRYHVNAQKLPWKVSIMDLYQDGVCTTLSASISHPVRAKIEQIETFVTGLWYEIEIAATLGIPNLCRFSELLPLVPASASPLAFIAGYGENKRPHVRSLEEMPHFLGGGQTQGGKSNMMHAMLCTFIARNLPEDVMLTLIDLKFNGIELHRYTGVPHLVTDVPGVPTGIAGNPEEGINVLRWLKAEGNRRGHILKNEGTQNLKAWNRKHRTRKMPYIVCAIDELALLRLDPKFGTEAYDLIREISSTARAAGIHLVTFTQSSNKRVIDEMIKVNFPGRICFSVPDASSSILFVGDGSAINLMPAGRARFKHGTDNFLAQTPLIQASEIQEIVNNAMAGKITAKLSKAAVTAEEVIEWSIDNNNSSLAVLDVYSKFSTRIEKAGVERLLQEMEGNTYQIADRFYQVLPGAGKRPRVVVKIDDEMVSQARKLQDMTQDAPISTPSTPAIVPVEEPAQAWDCLKCGAVTNVNPCEYCGSPVEISE